MKETANKTIEVIAELKEFIVKKIVGENILMEMDPDVFKLTQMSLQLVELTGDLLVKQAEMMEETNRKLDLLLERK
jgi:hypothetical protein